MTTSHAILAAALLGTTASLARGQNVDLSTIPERDTVQLTIYNSEDLTLVRETRHVTFARGVNPLQFSWAGTLIDPTSVDLRFKTHAGDLDVLDTTFPHDKPQMLYWNVESAFDGEAVVEITYFTSGITWAADYACTVDEAETAMAFDGFVRIENNSGEDYEDAQIRLVVGTINLVEKVADLARRGLISADDARMYFAREKKAAAMPAPARRALSDTVSAGVAAAESAPKEIMKQGLSEYFIYTIEGTETVKSTWSKRMRLFDGADVPFDVKYRYRPAEYGHQLVRLYILRNDEASSLGSTPLPDGVIRLFRDNGRDGLSFLVAHHNTYVPIGQEIEINLGVDPRVVHERLRLRDWRDDFWFRDTSGRKVFSPTQGPQIRPNYPVAGWNEHTQWTERIRNYSGQPIDVEFRLAFNGHVVFTSELDPILHDYRSPQFAATVPAGQTRDLLYQVTVKQGINAKQNDVTLEGSDAERETLVTAALLGAALTASARGQNVDLSTIPERDTVQLTIYNSEDLTLVRETRHVTFARGVNPLQFSWAGTLIDPTSVDLRFKTHAGDLDVLDTTFPHDKPQMLYWNVESAFDGEAVVEITYFTSGITWAADYACTVDEAETAMAFDGFVRIENNSGEDYEDARIRLVVGTINLVEKVADLARRGLISADDADRYRSGGLRLNQLEAAPRMELQAEMLGRMVADAPAAPKQIIKEGLSEYFIYTIEGTETVKSTWSKRMRLFDGADVPFDVKYRYRPAEYGHQLVRLYILRNDEASSLGSTPLPDGVIRLFRDNGRDGLSFLVAHHNTYVPIGQEIEINLGVDPRVVHERLRLRDWRDDFWFRDTSGRKVFSPTQGPQIRPDYPVAGWNEHTQWTERIRNYSGQPIDVEFRLAFNGHVVFTSELDPILHDYRSPQFAATVPAGRTRDLLYQVTVKQGINARQNDVTLETARE